MDLRGPLDIFHAVDESYTKKNWKKRLSLINESPVMYIQVKLNLKGMKVLMNSYWVSTYVLEF